MIEVQCTSCHTRYRIDERILPEGLPTFKCSRCGHVFSFDPRKPRPDGQIESTPAKPASAVAPIGPSAVGARPQRVEDPPLGDTEAMFREQSPSSAQQSMVGDATDISEASGLGAAPSRFQPEPDNDEERARGRERAESPDSQSQQRPTGEGPAPAEPLAAPQSSPHRKAKQAERFYSQLLTGKNPDAASGANLSFDFADEEPTSYQAQLTRRGRPQTQTTQTSQQSERWHVGDDDPAEAEPSSDEGSFGEAELNPRSQRQMRIDDTEPDFTDDNAFVDEEEAPVYNRAITHSARFVLLLIFLVGAGFGMLTLLINSAPSRASAVLSYLPMVGDRFVMPATPAQLVALRDVSAAYQHNKEGENALVISGTGENVGTASLRIVQLTAALRDAQRRSLASQAVYCGNSVSPGMIGQMTPHEIEFLLKLEPAKTFVLEPSATCRFVAVFLNPPGATHDYDVSVSQAVPGTAESAEEPAS
jgi:predicted Zn finger-like uncharacterized protein